MAAPIVSGIAGLALSINPQLTPKELRELIINTSDRLPALNGKAIEAE